MWDWKNWCRLCGDDGTNEADIFLKDMENNCSIADDLKRLCNLKLESTSELPSKICKHCKLNIKNLKEFVTKCLKTQQMLTEFQCSQGNDYDSIQKRYNLTSSSKIKKEEVAAANLVYKYESGEDEPTKNEQNEKITLIESLFASIDENLIRMNVVKEFPETSKRKKCSLANQPPSKNENITPSIAECIESKTASNCIVTENEKINSEINLKITTENQVKNKNTFTTYSCKICEKNFSKQSLLLIHMRVHHFIPPFTCQFCGKKLARQFQLERHENSHLPPEERTQLSCPYRNCNKKFNSDNGRWSHIHTIHDKRMVVFCDECGKECLTKHHLTKHKISHRLEKNHNCIFCNKKYKRLNKLNQHLKKHIGAPFECPKNGTEAESKILN